VMSHRHDSTRRQHSAHRHRRGFRIPSPASISLSIACLVAARLPTAPPSLSGPPANVLI
jgi:hypothetical protein